MQELLKSVAKFEKCLAALSESKSELLSVLRKLYAERMYEHGVGTRLSVLHEHSKAAVSYLSQVLSGRREPSYDSALLRIANAYVIFEKSRKKILQGNK